MQGTGGGPKAALVVSTDDRETLERWTRRRTTSQSLAMRARVVLACSSGMSNVEVAEELRVSNATVGGWRSRFMARGPAGLLDDPGSGAPRQKSATRRWRWWW